VLDLPSQLTGGSLDGLRLPGSKPARRSEDSADADAPAPVPPGADDEEDLDAYLAELARRDEGNDPLAEERAPMAQPTAAPVEEPEQELPEVKVPTPEQMEAALEAGDLAPLPDDSVEDKLVAQGAPKDIVGDDDRPLPGVVVGATLARELDVQLGDRVKVISPLTGIDTSLVRAGTHSPKSRDFKVIGIFQAGFQEYDSRLIYVDLYEAQAFQNQGDTVVGVEMTLRDIDKSEDVALRLERELGGGPFHTMDWRELNHNLFTALEMQKVMLSLVIATIIFVAAFNVVATLIMIVLEKRREIAILKAMGAKDSAILQVFMVQGASIGAVGTGIGLAIGGLICGYLNFFKFPLDPKVYLIDHLPIRTSWTEFAATILIAIGICVTATLIPSLWAARMLPADGVRPQ
jgi:lipoprotein-releasing system permease protein